MDVGRGDVQVGGGTGQGPECRVVPVREFGQDRFRVRDRLSGEGTGVDERLDQGLSDGERGERAGDGGPVGDPDGPPPSDRATSGRNGPRIG